MTRETLETIKGLVEEPVFIFIKSMVTNWGTDHCDFIFWEGCIMECILTFALLEYKFVSNIVGCEKAERAVI